MAPPNVPLHELNAAVQSAVERVLAQHGALGIDKLWIGFVAPEQFANMDTATKVATQISHTVNVQGTPSVAQLAPAAVGAGGGKEALPPKPGHIIGLVYNPQLKH